MSQEVLKTYTQQTLNFGVDFLSRLAVTTLPDDLKVMQKQLTNCFNELNRAWERMSKLPAKQKKDLKLDELKKALIEIEIKRKQKPKKFQYQKCKSFEFLADGKFSSEKPHIPPKLSAHESEREATPSPPSSSSVSPILPPKSEPSMHVFDTTDRTLGQNYVNCCKMTASCNYSCELDRKEIPSQSKGNTLPRERPVTDSLTEDDYLVVEKERQLPSISQFTQLNKMSNVIVNKWRLGERYCGISGGVLFIFCRFQDAQAEVSMELPKMYLGKDQSGKSILFQTREIHIELVSPDKDILEKFYQAAFKAQNKYDKLPTNPQLKDTPQIPRPYARNKSGPMYINISTTIAHKIRRWKPIKMRPSQTENDEDGYITLNPVNQSCEVPKKTSY